MHRNKKIFSWGVPLALLGIFTLVALVPAEVVKAQATFTTGGCYYSSTYPYELIGCDDPGPSEDFNPLPDPTGEGDVEPGTLPGADDPQVNSQTDDGGVTSSGGNPAAGLGGGVASAAGCIGAAQAARIAKEAAVKGNIAHKIKVSVTGPNVNTQAGEEGVVSFDAVAYCLLNAIIEYIVKATLAWIQSGLNGAPAFMDDPKKFGEGLLNKTVGDFAKNLQNDPNVPPDIKRGALSTLLSGYGGSSGSGFASMPGSNGMTSFINPGSFGASDFKLNAISALNSQATQASQNIMQTMVNGFFPYKEPGKKTSTTDSNGNPTERTGNAKITNPASNIANTASNRSEAAFNRLNLNADTFNKMISQFVQALISVVLKKLGGN